MTEMLYVCTVEELKKTGHRVVHGPDRPIVVFHDAGSIHAVDNRCPHMGFPLHRGSCVNGIITCPWHHARFDAGSGCAFDTFAGDAAPFDVEIRGESVYVSAAPRAIDIAGRARERLLEGLAMNNPLVCAKAILTLREVGTDAAIARDIALFGAERRDQWTGGLNTLTALMNLCGHLSEQTVFLALYQAARRVAADCDGQPPRRRRLPLENTDLPVERLKSWMREWNEVRHRDGAERTLLTAAQQSLPPDSIGSIFFGAATQRLYSEVGHVVDFGNKACELLDIIGWSQAVAVLPSVVERLVSGRGGEEETAWRAPVDLVGIVGSLSAELPTLVAGNADRDWNGMAALADKILVDDPRAIADSLREAARAGATAAQLAQSVAYAAAIRIGRFHPANEFGDWLTVLHSVSYCHAIHAALRRTTDENLVRGVVHGAMNVYLNRFLNVPPVAPPQHLDSLPSEPDKIRESLLATFDHLPSEDLAARLVARYLDLGHPIDALIDTLTLSVLKEDADFHTIQMLEAAVAESHFWDSEPERRTLLIAAARYLAAHAPTRRTQLQTAVIAMRLHRGEAVAEMEDVEEG